MPRPAALGLLALLVSAVPALAQWREPPRSMPARATACTVSRVIDGDTIRCRDGRTVRLRGVDAPERGEPRHAAATRALQQRVQGRTVTVVPHHRSHGRVVGDVLLNGRNVGREMHAAGWSKPRNARR
ncbi:MAG: thermonuclease family protein [Rhodovarius sp.]|nr:thermonuclease family protein [Rhodovarius sp.]MDW8315456.1 thermonuclease family protein [Rhodovarius sp.]